MSILESNRFQTLLQTLSSRVSRLERYAASGRWIPFTPIISGTGWAIGNGAAVGNYMRHGNTVTFWSRVTFGTTSTFGAGRLALAWPVEATTSISGRAGVFNAYAANASTTYLLYVSPLSVTAMELYANKVTVAALATPTYVDLAGVISTIPFTWAATHRVYVSGTYEVAE